MVFNQLLQAGAVDVVQLDSYHLGGISEVLHMAAKYSKPHQWNGVVRVQVEQSYLVSESDRI